MTEITAERIAGWMDGDLSTNRRTDRRSDGRSGKMEIAERMDNTAYGWTEGLRDEPTEGGKDGDRQTACWEGPSVTFVNGRRGRTNGRMEMRTD